MGFNFLLHNSEQWTKAVIARRSNGRLFHAHTKSYNHKCLIAESGTSICDTATVSNSADPTLTLCNSGQNDEECQVG